MTEQPDIEDKYPDETPGDCEHAPKDEPDALTGAFRCEKCGRLVLSGGSEN